LNQRTVTVTIPPISGTGGSFTTKTTTTPPHTTRSRPEVASIFRALESAGMVQVRISNGTLTVTLAGASLPNTFRIPLGQNDSTQGRTIGKGVTSEEILEAIIGIRSGSEGRQASQMLQALESGRTVTITADHGAVTLSVVGGTTVTLPAGSSRASGTLSGTAPAPSALAGTAPSRTATPSP